MNFINATLGKSGSDYTLTFDKNVIKVPNKGMNIDSYVGKEVVFGIRPENVYDDPEYIAANPNGVLEANVDVTELMGAEIYLYLNIAGIPITARVEPTSKAKPGDMVKIALDVNKIHIFDKDTELVIVN